MHPKTAGGGSLSHQAITSDPGRVECSISSISSVSPSGQAVARTDANAARDRTPWREDIGALKHWFSLRAEKA